MKESILRQKSEKFTTRIINMYKYLCKEKKEFVISKQVLRSGTSIGANVSEAGSAFTKKDFISKLGISLKENAETLHWLKSLKSTGFLSEKEFESIYNDCLEISRLLNASIKTAKKNMADNKEL
ncbi:MAG: four helix bundle protein [Proteobacteria bacterium]|nr:four helix bundle protein [Pseudomonadota bacterium]